jgi:hypothetical protein
MKSLSAGSLLLATLSSLLTGAPLVAQDVLISEFMASNSQTLNDEDGNSEDWIELLNRGNAPVDLGGWFLTDDAANLRKWMLPSLTLAPGQRRLVFASNKNRRDPAKELHTNFRLTASGEYLALVHPDGTTVEQDYAPSFPPQATDVSYGLGQTTTETVLLTQNSPATYLIPTGPENDVGDGTNPNAWIRNDFDDSGWTPSSLGVGYGVTANHAFDPFIGNLPDASGELGNQMQSKYFGVYIRIPFQLPNPGDVVSVKIRMKYDDGFVAYLNGDSESAAERNAPPVLAWDSEASASHVNTEAVVFEDLPVSEPTLLAGSNVLCIHGMNKGIGSSDLLMFPELVVTTASISLSPLYFTAPSPGTTNVGGAANPGPVIRDVTARVPPLATGTTTHLVTAEVLPTLDPVQSVTLAYRLMFGAEASITMLDNGTGGDALAGDRIFTAAIPTSSLAAGQMLRWRITAVDSQSHTTIAPPFPDPLDSPQYFGTIRADASIASSLLPVLHWFIQTPTAADSRTGSRGSLYYLGQFYDNLKFDLHGQSTGGFPKKSYDIDFNGGDRFRWKEGEGRVKDINLLTNWADKSKVRNTLGYEIMRKSGHPGHFAFQVRVQQNGQFFSTADMVEDGDDRYLERVGLDPNGALYKMYNRFDSSTTNVNKKTRKEEDNSDLQAVITGLGLTGDNLLRYGYDNLNIPSTINYLAALDMTNNRDHGHKNYYVYRDTEGTGEWTPLVWDIDLNLGRNWVSGPAYFDDTYTNNALRAGQTNRLKTFIFNNATHNQMFLRRVRTLMDKIIQPPGTVNGYLEQRVNEIRGLVDPDGVATTDADLDYTKWGSWGNMHRAEADAARILNEHIPTRRTQLYNLAEVPASQPLMAPVNIGTIDFNPASNGASPDQRGEYFTLTNPNSYAVDISDWTIGGAVDFTMPAGTVIPVGGTLHVGRDAVGFRSRTVSPKANEKAYLVSGYKGQLSARGETIILSDDLGNVIATKAYAAQLTNAQQWLRITEFLFDPAPASTAEKAALPGVVAGDFEFIELTNTGPSALDIGGAMLAEGILFTFPANTILQPDARILIVANLAAFTLRYGAGHPVAGQYSGNLDNDGEKLQLLDGTGENVLEFTYNDSWYYAANQLGYSLVLRDPAGTPYDAFGQSARWGVSESVGGNPGTAATGVATDFTTWKSTRFTVAELADPLVTGPTIDSDGDGLNTLMEYAFGRNPKLADASESFTPQIVSDAGSDYLALVFRRQKNAPDLAYEVLVTGDFLLKTGATQLVGIPSDNGDGTANVTIRDFQSMSASDRRFIQVRVTLNP